MDQRKVTLTLASLFIAGSAASSLPRCQAEPASSLREGHPERSRFLVRTRAFRDAGRRAAKPSTPTIMTAAHRTLPFGTKVKVVNKRTGKSVVVRINDRGPYAHGRVIDLSKASAQALGISGVGSVDRRPALQAFSASTLFHHRTIASLPAGCSGRRGPMEPRGLLPAFPRSPLLKEGFWKRMKIGRSLDIENRPPDPADGGRSHGRGAARAKLGRSSAGKRDGARSECRAAEADSPPPSPTTGRHLRPAPASPPQTRHSTPRRRRPLRLVRAPSPRSR